MKKRFLFSLLVFCILFSVSVSAFSMSPGSYRFEYDEINGLQEEFPFVLRSSSSQPIILSIAKSDSLMEYVEVDVEEVLLQPREAKQVNVKLNIPPGLDKVDVQEAKITFTKSIQSDQGGFMVVTTALRARILVTFAYPGEYITIVRLSPVNVNQGEDTVVHWEVQARGTSTTRFMNNLSIFDIDDNVVFSKDFPRGFLERNQRYSETTAVPSRTFLPGDYRVLLESASADNVVEESRVLRIGKEDIGLLNFSPENFTVGEMVMFSFVVENLWNDVFSNVYGVLDVGGVSTTTRSVRLGAFDKVEIDRQYIDLRNLDEGSHNGSLTVFFDGNSKTFDVELLALPVPRSGVAFSGNVVWISASVVILLIVVVLLVFLFKKSNNYAKGKRKVR